jgi:hypothetical protein
LREFEQLIEGLGVGVETRDEGDAQSQGGVAGGQVAIILQDGFYAQPRKARWASSSCV